ncbi:MAG: Fic family protein [Kiritimatiellae bacterium]|nr:Fic family protein [Kiritimatiellia bacterium]
MTNLDKVIDFLHFHPGTSRTELMKDLKLGIKDTQMKALLSSGVQSGDIRVEGKARATRYFITPKAHLLRTINLDSYYSVDLDHREMQTSYNFDLISKILPEVDIFTKDEYKFLLDRENTFLERIKKYPKELYLKEMERLGIDLSWKSSEIEGNTYTLLETINLLKDKVEATGKKREEAIMLLNHKEALKAIIEQPSYFLELSLARIEDIHSILIDGLGVERNLRHIRVGISGTRYRPLDVESQLKEAIQDMCSLVNRKHDPYEKTLLALLLISYIQPFTDGNKRTSRLIANSLLISRSLCPLSFRTVDANDYRAALLLFYEQNNISAFKKIFLEQVEFATNEYF